MLWTLFAITQGGVFVTEHVRRPVYHDTVYESACGEHVFRIAYRNGSSEAKQGPAVRNRGLVETVTIGGRTVANAAYALQTLTAGRSIARVGIIHCGLNPDIVFQGVLETSPVESKNYQLNPDIYFRIKLENKTWIMSLDYKNG